MSLFRTVALTSERGLFLRLKIHHRILIATCLKLLAIAIPRLILKAVTRVLKIFFCDSRSTGFFAYQNSVHRRVAVKVAVMEKRKKPFINSIRNCRLRTNLCDFLGGRSGTVGVRYAVGE
jgi:hypothetical protein